MYVDMSIFGYCEPVIIKIQLLVPILQVGRNLLQKNMRSVANKIIRNFYFNIRFWHCQIGLNWVKGQNRKNN